MIFEYIKGRNNNQINTILYRDAVTANFTSESIQYSCLVTASYNETLKVYRRQTSKFPDKSDFRISDLTVLTRTINQYRLTPIQIASFLRCPIFTEYDVCFELSKVFAYQLLEVYPDFEIFGLDKTDSEVEENREVSPKYN